MFMPTRLQIGASRLENLSAEALQKFLDKTWVHLGDREKEHSFANIIEVFRQKNLLDVCYLIFFRVIKYISPKKKEDATIAVNYDATNFMPFNYKKGNYLPFQDNSFSYIFSEHFFEHLFLDEALALFKECYRVLGRNGVIRTCVPDADLRPSPEPLGYPSIKMSYSHPDKHKTRWSVYSLTEVIRLAGFEPVPVRYYDRLGQGFEVSLTDLEEIYQSCADAEMVLDLTHIQRKDSLIIDGIK
jgi:predicted SAM-dependent methyltransferase